MAISHFQIPNVKQLFSHISKRWLFPVISINTPRWHVFNAYRRYISDWLKYRTHSDEVVNFLDSYPCLFDNTDTTPFDAHYFYQAVWATKNIKSTNVDCHIDIGSDIRFASMLTAITCVRFIDIRPIMAPLEDFYVQPGSILALPFADNSLQSISCLHVAEHIGLGRYGDPLDPKGTEKAVRELSRVLAANGNLYFSLPVGRERVCFNAHRVHSPIHIIDYFHDLDLLEFSAVDDHKNYRRNIKPSALINENYACGLFHFTKR